jgi:hypothetical protein
MPSKPLQIKEERERERERERGRQWHRGKDREGRERRYKYG